MKILITRSTSEASIGSLRRTLEIQRTYYPLCSEITQVIVSNEKVSDVGLETVVCPDLVGPGGFWHGKVRNLAFKAALDFGADILLPLDSDAVFLGFPVGCFISDFERLKAFYQNENEKLTAVALSDIARWQFNSWWVFRRNVFSQKWCHSYEGFIGYGWDDYDFLHNIAIPNGCHIVNSQATAIHLWHHPKRHAKDAEFDLEFLRNKRLYESRAGMS